MSRMDRRRIRSPRGGGGIGADARRRPWAGRLSVPFLVLVAASLAVAPSAFASVTVTVTPEAATNEVGTEHTVTVTFVSDGFKLANTEVTFRITAGPNAGLERTLTTDRDGRVVFRYTSQSAGTDTIEIVGIDPDTRATIRCPTATKTWVRTEEEPEPPASDPGVLLELLSDMNGVLDGLLHDLEDFRLALLFQPNFLRNGLDALVKLFRGAFTGEPFVLGLLPDVAGIPMRTILGSFANLEIDSQTVRNLLAEARESGTSGTPSATQDVLNVLDTMRGRLEELRGHEHDGGAAQFMQDLKELEDYVRDVMLEWANAPDPDQLLARLASFTSGADFSLASLPGENGVFYAALHEHLRAIDRLLGSVADPDFASLRNLAEGFGRESTEAERDAVVAVLREIKEHKEATERDFARWFGR